VLFESAADVFGSAVIGVVLTGTNRDGAAGLARIKARGGTTIVQDPETALRRAMPDAALASTTVDWTLPLETIGARLIALCDSPPRAGEGRASGTPLLGTGGSQLTRGESLPRPPEQTPGSSTTLQGLRS